MINIKSLLLIAFTLIIISLPLQAEVVRVAEAQGGFEGFYRVNEFCPLKFNLVTGNNPFKGYLEINTKHISYLKHFDMPSKSRKELFLAILIYEPIEEIKFNIYPEAHRESEYSGRIPLKAVASGQFLIGVEENLYDSFIIEFSRYTEASRHSYFVKIIPEQLPENWQLLEAMDLIVLSDGFVKNGNNKEILELWQKFSGGNLLIKNMGQQFNLKGISRFAPRPHGVFSDKSDMYDAFGKASWLSRNKESLYKYLIIYFLFSIAVLLVWFWVRENQKNYLIISLVLGGLNVLFVGLIFAFCLIPPDFTSDSLRVTTLNQKEKLVEEEIISTVNPLKAKTISVNLNNEFARIVYPDIRVPEFNAGFDFVINEGNRPILKFESRKKHPGFMLETRQARKTDIFVSVDKKTIGETLQYKIVNIANSDLSDSFLVSSDKAFYIGMIKSGEVRNMSMEKNTFIAKEELINKHFPENRQKRLLEAYLKGKDPGDCLIGWSGKPGNQELMIIKIGK